MTKFFNTGVNDEESSPDFQQKSGYFDPDSTFKVTDNQYENVALNPLEFAQGFAKKVAQGYEAVKEAGLGAAGTVMNQLPDRFNLFARYMTGVGNRNLQLDPSTLTDLRRATEKTPNATVKFQVFPSFATTQLGKSVLPEILRNSKNIDFLTPQYGPGIPTSGPVYPYFTGAPKSVTNTLGRYTANVNPSTNTVEFKDTYDMVNKAEDPSLISGKIQPQKAWNELEAIWNPAAGMRNLPKPFKTTSVDYSPETVSKGLQVGGESPTFSPATRMARALMYVTPWKPTPFNIDITVPMRGEIK